MQGLLNAWRATRSLKVLIVLYVLAVVTHVHTIVGAARGTGPAVQWNNVVDLVLALLLLALITVRYRHAWKLGLLESAYTTVHALYLMIFMKDAIVAQTLQATKDSSMDEETRLRIMETSITGAMIAIVVVALLKGLCWYLSRGYFSGGMRASDAKDVNSALADAIAKNSDPS